MSFGSCLLLPLLLAGFAVLAAIVLIVGRRVDPARRSRVGEALFGAGGHRLEPTGSIFGLTLDQLVVGRHRVGDVHLWDRPTARSADGKNPGVSLIALRASPPLDLVVLRRGLEASLARILARFRKVDVGRTDLDSELLALTSEPGLAESLLAHPSARRGLEALVGIPAFARIQVDSGTDPAGVARGVLGLDAGVCVELRGELDRHAVEDLERAIEALAVFRSALEERQGSS
jgi:hypothetical protein